ncbi:MAG: thioredoxin family protein [Gammaproteobacteria bacterium]|nr:thioredoxin family protein [Gammaproteobacteria bacterium]
MMKRAMVLRISLCLAVTAVLAGCYQRPAYDESADARSTVHAALADARRADKLVLLVFGANWCPDCRVFDEAMADPVIARIVKRDFVVAKVDVGNWDKHPGVVAAFDNPIEGGIPAVVVADDRGEVLFSTKAGQLSTARRMGMQAFMAFFETLKATAES